MSLLILGIESSCDETGVALVRTTGTAVPTLLAHALHSQIEMHQAYGGVVPELASRDHIRRVLPLATQVLHESGQALSDIDVVAYTRGPGLAGALLVGAGVACALGAALGKPVLGVHHLEGHLLSPFLRGYVEHHSRDIERVRACLTHGARLRLTPSQRGKRCQCAWRSREGRHSTANVARPSTNTTTMPKMPAV